jgi:hypothetical protein
MKTITVVDAKGRELNRVLLQMTDTTVLICTKDEWIESQKEGREPTCVGFPKSSVVGHKIVKTS